MDLMELIILRTYLPSVLWHWWLGHLTR